MSSSETTPLLNPESAAEPGVHGPVHLPLHNGGGDAGTDSRPDPRGRDRYLFLRIGHWTNLVLAPTVAALAITVDTIYEGGHPRDYTLPWCIQQSMDLVIFWSVISLVCSAGNLVRYRVSKTLLFPDILALAFHFLVGAYLSVTATDGLSNLTRPYGQCVKGGYPNPDRPADPACLEWGRKFERWVWSYLVVLAASGALNLVLSWTHTLYLVKSVRSAWRDGFGGRPGGWEGILPVYLFEVDFRFRIGRPAREGA